MALFYFFLGMAALQVVFTSVFYLLIKKKEYLYYTLFTVFLSTYIVMAFRSPSWAWYQTEKGSIILAALNLMVPLAILFYYKFIRYFIDAGTNYSRLNRHFRIAEKIIGSVVLGLFLLRWLGGSELGHQSFVVMMFLIVPLNLYFLVKLILIRQKLPGIVAIGSFLLFLFARFAVFASLFNTNQNLLLVEAPIAFSIGGILLDFVFFDFALIYKTQLVYKENLRLAIEKQEDLNRQRLLISNDLHDDIGSSLSSIQLELALAAKSEQSPQSLQQTLLKVSEEVKSVLENMNDIIWAIKKSSGDEKRFSNRIKDYYFDLMDARQINCTYEIDNELELLLVSSTCRKNLLLIAKEALNNSIKHSDATKILVKLHRMGDHLQLEISDNGIGFDQLRKNTGNGLESMRLRSKQMQGKLNIESYPGTGSQISCTIPLSSI